ncbi:MAG: DUF898 family protein [Gammaproteobacteria bacterium]|nr:DUF898 family protein [Gammaproteobacteria bacterium]
MLLNMLASAMEGHPRFDVLMGCIVIVGLLLTVVAVAWYNEQVYRTLAGSIRIDDVELKFHGTWHGLARLYLTNLVMNLVSFGISWYSRECASPDSSFATCRSKGRQSV